MKHSTYLTSFRQAYIALTCLIAVLLFSQCKGMHKSDLQTTPAWTGQPVTSDTKKIPPKSIPDVDDSRAPIGFWTEEEAGLYVSIEPRTEQDLEEGYQTAVGDLSITVGGPPNRRMNADDIFFISKQALGKNNLTMTGFFNWDRNKSKVEIQVSWTRSSVELEIFKNEQFTHYETKRYVLKLRK